MLNPNFPKLQISPEDQPERKPPLTCYSILVTPNNASVFYAVGFGGDDLLNLLHSQSYLLNPADEITQTHLKNILASTGFSIQQLEEHRAYLNSLLTPEVRKSLLSQQTIELPDELKGVSITRLG